MKRNRPFATCLRSILLLSIALAGPWSHAETLLRVGVPGVPVAFANPYRSTGIPNIYAMGAVFDGLTRIDEHGEVQPWLATSWERTGPLRWVIHLRKRVRFSNGRPFTAAAVVNVVDFFVSEDSTREMVAREFNFIERARALDEHTVEIVTQRPAPLLPRSLPIMYMVEPDEWRRLGPVGFSLAPIGTGPFRVDGFKPNKIELSAFKDSWRKPQVDRLEIIAIADTAARAQGVQSGTIDIAMSIGPDEVAAIEAFGGRGINRSAASVWSINFVDKPGSPFKDRRVREALNYAVNREVLTEVLLDGVAVPANQPAARVCFGYNPDLPPIPYDPARAKQLLEEAGFGDGFKFVVQGTLSANAAASSIFQVMAQDMARVGVEMEIRPVTVAEIMQNVLDGGWEGEAFSLNYNHEPSVDAIRGLNNHSCLWHHPWYCDERIMPAIRQATVELDRDRALALRHEIMAFYRQEYASLFLYEYAYFAGVSATVSGFSDVHGFLSFEDVTLDTNQQ